LPFSQQPLGILTWNFTGLFPETFYTGFFLIHSVYKAKGRSLINSLHIPSTVTSVSMQFS